MKIKMEIFFYIFLLSVAIAVVAALPPNVFSHAVFTEPGAKMKNIEIRG